MTYVLSFYREPSKSAPRVSDIIDFFKARANYKIGKSEAIYENEDTGVYFSFTFGSGSKPSPKPELAYACSFEMNYCRPPFFAAEAQIELHALVQTFSFLVDDLQEDGMGVRAVFSSAGFLKGYNYGNLVGIMTLAKEYDQHFEHCRPNNQLISIWRWNYQLNELQARVGNALFVPRIHPILICDKLQTAIIWADLIPCLLPAVETILVVRVENPKQPQGSKRLLPVPFADIAPLLTNFQSYEQPLRHWLLRYSAPPPALLRLERSAKELTTATKPTMLPWENIMASEFVDETQ